MVGRLIILVPLQRDLFESDSPPPDGGGFDGSMNPHFAVMARHMGKGRDSRHRDG